MYLTREQHLHAAAYVQAFPWVLKVGLGLGGNATRVLVQCNLTLTSPL